MDERDLPTAGGQPAAPTGEAGVDEVQAAEVAALDPAQHAQELLAEHVPLTLLVDLLTPTGETSADLLEEEGLPDDAWWTTPTDQETPGA